MKERRKQRRMKKKILSILLISTMALSLIACGGGKKEETATTTPEDEEWNEIVEEVYNNSEEERGEAVEEKTGYARSPKWDEISAPYMAVQIQDYFFETGMTVGELYDMMKDNPDFVWKSNDEDHTYNPDEMREAKSGRYFRLDFGPEVDFGWINPNDIETSLKDCICASFSFDIMNPDVYAFGYNGKNEILYKWTVDDVKDMMKPGGMLEGFEILNESSTYLRFENTNLTHEYFDKCKITFKIYENQVEHISINFGNSEVSEGYY